MQTPATQHLVQFHTIAILTDLTTDVERTLGYAGALARSYGAELIVSHACIEDHYAFVPSQRTLYPFPVGRPSQETEKQRIQSLLGKIGLHDLKYRALINNTSIPDLLKALDTYHPDLVVLATHGREGLSKWFSGSVAEDVFRRIHWPVLVLGPHLPETLSSEAKHRRVCYATDLSEASTASLQYASGLARDNEGTLLSLYIDPDPSEEFSFNRDMELQKLSDWIEAHSAGQLSIPAKRRCQVEFGNPAVKIVEVAAEWHADLLVLGARGFGSIAGLASHFLGGTAYQVACFANCPVLIVPHRK